MSESAVQFATSRRVHISLAVSNVDDSTQFYRKLLNLAPTKTRDGYARFEVAEPPLNLSIIQSGHAKGHADPTSHFGIQVKSSTVVEDLQRRLETEGLATRPEDSVNCCHAVQDKIWVEDPDGYRWEVFVVLDDAPVSEADSGSVCCPPTQNDACCTIGGEPCCSEGT